MPSITTKPTFWRCGYRPVDDLQTGVGNLRSQLREKQIVGVAVGWQTCEFYGSAYHFLTVVWALFGVEVQHRPLVVRKLCRISEAFAVCECCGYDGTDVESLLALGFACGGGEVAECAYDRAVAEQHFGSHRQFVGHTDLR